MFKSITFGSHDQGMTDVTNLRRSSQAQLGEVVGSLSYLGQAEEIKSMFVYQAMTMRRGPMQGRKD